ncbi:MAG: ATP synthase F1 subunit delta [Flavobacteriaceae bacterium]|nr:ATP synthase F1 subunit delta [Flavobacteriaceae bacterium]
MKQTRAAIRYAKALLNLAIDTNKADEVNENMLTISSTIEQTKDLNIMLHSPVIKASAKKDALLAIFGNDINNISKGLINQLVENKRLAILESIARKYLIIYDHYKGTQVAKVTTAIPLTDELQEKVLDKVKDIVGTKVTLENIVDPSIIGGFILNVGDKQYDASILGKMNNLRRQFDDNLYVPNF